MTTSLDNVFTLSNLYLQDENINIKIDPEGFFIEGSSDLKTISKEELKSFEIFSSCRKYCLRIFHEGSITEILNISQNDITRLQKSVSELFGMTLPITELETLSTIEGNLYCSNNLLTLRTNKPIFSVPKALVRKVVEIDNEVQVSLDKIEIVLSTDFDVCSYFQNKTSEQICVIEQVTCIYPRSKVNILLFEDCFISKGTSYDHSIMFENVDSLLSLRTDSENYLVVRLINPILQGQTKYDAMVFSLNSKEIEIVTKSSFLKEYYRGSQSDVVTEILEKMSKKPLHVSMTYFSCTHKVNEGKLFCLDHELHFLHKSISIPLDTIKFIELGRIDFGALKTFDATIMADKMYVFSYIDRKRFSEFQKYCDNSGIKYEFVEYEEEDGNSGDNEEDEEISYNTDSSYSSDVN